MLEFFLVIPKDGSKIHRFPTVHMGKLLPVGKSVNIQKSCILRSSD